MKTTTSIFQHNTLGISTQILNRPLSPSKASQILLPLRPPQKLTTTFEQTLPEQLPKPNKPSLILTPSTNIATITKRVVPKNTKNGTPNDVLRLLDGLNLPISPDTYSLLIKECTETGDPVAATELYTHLRRSGIKPSLGLVNRVLLMYVSCECLHIARELFDGMLQRDFNSWAVLIVGYLEKGEFEEGFRLFQQMGLWGRFRDVPPGWFVACLLKACVTSANLELGKQVHGWVLKMGASEERIVTTSLFRLYVKFKCVDSANVVFARLDRCCNSSIWTAKIVNECRGERFGEAFRDFIKMERAGIGRNRYTFSSILKACGKSIGDGHCGLQIHAKAIKVGLESDASVQCSLVEMYGKFGTLGEARKVFDVVRDDSNVACWKAMVKAYLQHGSNVEAIKLLYQMKAVGLLLEDFVGESVKLIGN